MDHKSKTALVLTLCVSTSSSSKCFTSCQWLHLIDLPLTVVHADDASCLDRQIKSCLGALAALCKHNLSTSSKQYRSFFVCAKPALPGPSKCLFESSASASCAPVELAQPMASIRWPDRVARMQKRAFWLRTHFKRLCAYLYFCGNSHSNKQMHALTRPPANSKH